MRTTIRLNPALKAELERAAESDGLSFTRAVEEAAQLWLKSRPAHAQRETSFRVPVLGSSSGQSRSMEDIERALGEADAEQLRKWGVPQDVSDPRR